MIVYRYASRLGQPRASTGSTNVRVQLHSCVCCALLSVLREASAVGAAARAIRHSRGALNRLVRLVPTHNKRAQLILALLTEKNDGPPHAVDATKWTRTEILPSR